MKAVGFYRSLPISEPESLLDIEMPDPAPMANDLLVEIEAISINPADAKIRIRSAAEKPHEEPLILGYDAVGIVRETGSAVSSFKAGDRVWYAGDVNRAGSYSTMQCVDYRLASLAPTSVSPESAAALPLTTLTAWETLFKRLEVPTDTTDAKLLIIGGAGGVGSMTAQLARKLTGLHITATASRPETSDWCLKLGAHQIVNHRNLVEECQNSGLEDFDYIVQFADLAQHWDAMCELVAPQGKIGTIVETDENLNISALQGKSASLHWELMFTRSIYQTNDMYKQGQILARVANLVDDKIIQTTETTVLNGLSAKTIKEAHELIETGSTIGKLVIKF